MERRRAGQAGREGRHLSAPADEKVPGQIERWQRELPCPGLYGLEVETSRMSPLACADLIRERREKGDASPSAFQRLAAGGV